jgi:uncharacterized membrane protein YhaH (DUF805 family)
MSWSLYYFFLVNMETIQETSKVNYTFKEKFLLVWPEQRLSWRRAWLRIFSSSIAIWLLAYFFTFVWTLIFQFTSVTDDIQMIVLSTVSVIITYWLSWIIDPVLITKRTHDFDDSGVTYVKIYKVILLLLGTISIVEIFQKNVFWILFSNISIVINIGLLLFLIYILNKSWIKWDNQYWPDDSNVKTGFLG